MANVRGAVPADAVAIGRVHVAGWQVGYRGQMPQDHLDSLDAAQSARRWSARLEEAAAGARRASPPGEYRDVALVVEDDDGRVAGFASIGRLRDPHDDDRPLEMGEVQAIYIDPDRWESGFGAALLSGAERELVAMGFRRAALWVLVTNVRARGFYERLGWCATDHVKVDDRFGFTLTEVRYDRVLEAE